MARELLLRWERRAAALEDDHAFATPGLGVTMADGGERIDEAKPRRRSPAEAVSGTTPVRCPFLREEQVKSCQVAPFRKSLARSSATGEGELCTSADHRSCPALRESHEAHPDASRCPFLRESLVQFCAASPRPTYVPWSESPEPALRPRRSPLLRPPPGRGRLGARAGPPDRRPRRRRDRGRGRRAGAGWLWYTDNHLWLDVGDDGLCHVGVDAFLARLVGEVERLTFLTVKGDVRPAVVLTVGGVDLTLVFAQHLPLVCANTRLRSGLAPLVADLYGLGLALHRPVGRGDGRPARRARGPRVDGL